MPGDHVDLAVQLRDPERMDHVTGPGDEVHALARRDVDLVRGDGRRARVAHLPEPLVADDLDRHRRRPRVRRVRRPRHHEVGHDEHRDVRAQWDGDAEHHHESRCQALALAEQGDSRLVAPEPADEEQEERAAEHRSRGGEHPPPQRRDLAGRLRAWVERRLVAASGDGDGKHEHGQQRPDARARAPWAHARSACRGSEPLGQPPAVSPSAPMAAMFPPGERFQRGWSARRR